MSSIKSYCTITLGYLVVRVVNIISVKPRCLHLTFILVILVQGVGGKLFRLVYLAPPPRIQTVSSVSYYCTIILEYLVVRDINIISVKHQTFSLVTLIRGWGASSPGWFILPPAQDLGQTVSSVNSYCTIILEYLVVRDVNVISAKLDCGLSILSEILGGGQDKPPWTACPPTPCQYVTQLNI